MMSLVYSLSAGQLGSVVTVVWRLCFYHWMLLYSVWQF